MDENKNTAKINSEELDVAEKEAEKSGYTYTHKFAKPFECEGKKYEELTFDWGSLTGQDSLAIEREMAQLGLPLVTPEFSGEYLVRMAARACTMKIGSDVLCRLPLKDFNRIRSRARSFLLKLEL